MLDAAPLVVDVHVADDLRGTDLGLELDPVATVGALDRAPGLDGAQHGSTREPGRPLLRRLGCHAYQIGTRGPDMRRSGLGRTTLRLPSSDERLVFDSVRLVGVGTQLLTPRRL